MNGTTLKAATEKPDRAIELFLNLASLVVGIGHCKQTLGTAK